MPRLGNKGRSPSGSKSVKVVLGFSPQLLNHLLRSQRHCIPFRYMIISITRPPRQLRTWEYYHQNRTIKLDFMRRQRQVLECFWKSDQKSTLIAGFWTCNEQGTSRGSKPVHIGDLHMGLISRLHQLHASHPAMNLATYLDNPGHQ